MNKAHGSIEKRLYITPEAQLKYLGIKCCENRSSLRLHHLSLPNWEFAGFLPTLEEEVDWELCCIVILLWTGKIILFI